MISPTGESSGRHTKSPAGDYGPDIWPCIEQPAYEVTGRLLRAHDI
jgi:hypothetical protein